MTPTPGAHTHPDTPSPEGPVVRVNGVTKTFGPIHALNGVDLQVYPGQIFGVLGPNGAGKTTLLRILLGLVRADGGTVSVLDSPPGHSQALRNIGALIERPAFVPHLSGRDNLTVLARARALPDSEVQRVLEVVQLDQRADDRFSGYSLGMGQRLGVAAALLGKPGLLILDEPTNGLDPEGVASMRELVRKLGTGGTTILLSSHLLSEVEQVCERVVVIDRGRVLADDSVTTLRANAGGTTLDIHADPPERTLAVLREHADGARVSQQLAPADDNTSTEDDTTAQEAGADGPMWWRMETEPSDVPGLVRALVAADVDVHEIRRQRRSLEDVFFALTQPTTGEEQP